MIESSTLTVPSLTAHFASSRFCVAPMMDWTDRHCRYFMRLMTRHALLYTEMITTDALMHGDVEKLLRYHPTEHPLALQLGGSCPEDLARCATVGEKMGYDEINFNVGCPSDRVQHHKIGACLMREPELVHDCVAAMKQVCKIPVTVKHRLGLKNHDSDALLKQFVGRCHDAGCDRFIVHARIAILEGLSPKDNRSIPPLQYDRVWQLKARNPLFQVVINGGIDHLGSLEKHLQQVDGVMLGRAAYHNSYLLAQVDPLVFHVPPPLDSRAAVLEKMLPYIEDHLTEGGQLHHITRHLLGIAHGIRGGRAYRQLLSAGHDLKQNPLHLMNQAIAIIKQD